MEFLEHAIEVDVKVSFIVDVNGLRGGFGTSRSGSRGYTPGPEHLRAL